MSSLTFGHFEQIPDGADSTFGEEPVHDDNRNCQCGKNKQKLHLENGRIGFPLSRRRPTEQRQRFHVRPPLFQLLIVYTRSRSVTRLVIVFVHYQVEVVTALTPPRM